MNVSFTSLILSLIGCLSLINANQSSDNQTLTMLMLTTIRSPPPLISHYLRRRSSIEVIYTTSNLTDDSNEKNISSSINDLQPYEHPHGYSMIKDRSSKLRADDGRIFSFFLFEDFTKTQIKVIVTVVIIISLIMLVIALFRFKWVIWMHTSRRTCVCRFRSSPYVPYLWSDLIVMKHERDRGVVGHENCDCRRDSHQFLAQIKHMDRLVLEKQDECS